MKKFSFISIIVMICIGLVSCGVNCKGEPSKKAKYVDGGGYGMQYHFILYYPQGDAGHTPSLKCTKYTYVAYDVYTDDLGKVSGANVIWHYERGEDNYFNQIKESAIFIFDKSKVTVSGLYDGNEYLNGTYPVK